VEIEHMAEAKQNLIALDAANRRKGAKEKPISPWLPLALARKKKSRQRVARGIGSVRR
jgi:hypothetical protein